MKTGLASLTFVVDESRQFRPPADGPRSLLYVFGPEHTLGARAYSAIGQDFEQVSSQDHVRLEFWADGPWTDVVQPGASFAFWYGGDVGHGKIESLL